LFNKIREKYSAHMQCGKGCTACCHGLFDISLADAVEVARGFSELPLQVRKEVHSRASHLHSSIRTAAAALPEPTLVNEDDSRIDHIVNLSTTRHVRFLETPANVSSMNAGRCPVVWRAYQ
jgi:hypothetical protein